MNSHERSLYRHKRFYGTGDAWFLLFALLLGLGTLFGLTRLSDTLTAQSAATQPGTATGITSGMPPAFAATVQAAQVRLYRVSSTDVGLMQPAVDVHGNVWVGEMYANRFARLEAHTGAVTTWIPPHAQGGIMSTTIDAQGKAWFVEQGANYLGRFDPAQQSFRIFPLGSVGGRPLGPQDLQFDAKGFLWFTALVGGHIGRLDPVTGALRTWPVPAPAPGIVSAPFSLAVTSHGQVWFGDLTGGAVGHLDPGTGHVTLYHLADPQAQVFSMAADRTGRLWFTEIIPGKLGMLDPATGKVTEWALPTVAGHPAALYQLVVTQSGAIWFVNNGADALVRYVPGQAGYTFFRLDLPASAPYGLALDPAGRLWFTAAGSSANYIGEVTP